MRRKKNVAYLVVLALCVSLLITPIQPSLGRPGSIMNTVSSPGVGASASEKRDIGAGDMSYASRTGAFEYSYPIVVPPGRLGMEPSLALSYSSQGSLRGGIASNWSMSIPTIEVMSSSNTDLMGIYPTFRSSMSGGHALVRVTESVESGWIAYRAEYDDQYIRYEKNAVDGMWRARTLDGKTWYFGIGHTGENHSMDAPEVGPLMSHFDEGVPRQYRLPHHIDHRQPLTRVVDRFGNTIRYFWDVDVNPETDFAESMRISSIRYSENVGASLASHARVDFNYEPEEYCPGSLGPSDLPPGAAMSHRGELHPWFSGRQALNRVETFVKEGGGDRLVRRVQLDIESICADSAGAIRELKSITLTDPTQPYTTAQPIQPSITFDYSDTVRQFDGTTEFTGFNYGQPFSEALYWGKTNGYDNTGEPTLESTLLDFDGDGLLDLVRVNCKRSAEGAWRRRNHSC